MPPSPLSTFQATPARHYPPSTPQLGQSSSTYSSPHTPSTFDQARRTQLPSSAGSFRSTHSPRFASHNTLHRALNTTLPDSPAGSNHKTPPSSFPARLQNSVELHPIRPPSRSKTESPLDDRYSAILEDPFEYAEVTDHQNRRTMERDRFSITLPRSEKAIVSNGGPLPVPRPASAAPSSHFSRPLLLSHTTGLSSLPLPCFSLLNDGVARPTVHVSRRR